jgi:SnoaL-like protein
VRDTLLPPFLTHGAAIMAKRKVAPKAAKKSAKKKSAKRTGASKPRGGGSGGDAGAKTGPISSGRGLTPHEIGRAVIEHFNSGRADDSLWDKFWSDDFVCIEGMGLQWAGRKAVAAKNDEWMAQHIIHGGAADGPYVGATGFAIKFRIDVEDKATHSRHTMEEVGVYTVRDGKVVREEFMYGKIMHA